MSLLRKLINYLDLRKNIFVYCGNHTKPTNPECRKSIDYLNFNAADKYINYYNLDGYI
jgi:hypothetical protein